MENKVFEFIEKWLPDYQEKWNNYECVEAFKEINFSNFYFHEAKENFAKTQREICAERARILYKRTGGIINDLSYAEIDRDLIINAPTP